MNELFNNLKITAKKNTNRKRKLSNEEQEYQTSAEPPNKRRKLNKKLLTKKEDIPQCSCCGATMVCIEKSKLYEGGSIDCDECNKDIGGDFVYHCTDFNCSKLNDWDICYPKCSVEQPQERTKKKVIKKKWIVLMKMMIWIMMEIMISI